MGRCGGVDTEDLVEVVTGKVDGTSQTRWEGSLGRKRRQEEAVEEVTGQEERTRKEAVDTTVY